LVQLARQNELGTECTLKELLADPSTGRLLPFSACAHIWIEIAKLLLVGAAHGEISPQNILIGGEGSVRLAEDSAGLSEDIAYLAPERIRGNKADARSDLFSLAALFSEALTGVSFQTAKLMNQTAKNPLSLVEPDVPTALVAIVRRALSLKPEERFPDITQMYTLVKPLMPQALLDEGKRALATAVQRVSGPVQTGYEPSVSVAEEPREERSYTPAPEEPDWQTATQATAPVLTTQRERALTNSVLGYQDRPVRKRIRKLWVALGVLAVIGAIWLVSFLRFLGPLSEAPSERVDTSHNQPIYQIPGPGGRCLLELDSKPTGAVVRVNRFWSGGMTPTILSLPCQHVALITLKAPSGLTTHQFYRPTKLVETRKYKILKSFYARLAAGLRLVIAFHTSSSGK